MFGSPWTASQRDVEVPGHFGELGGAQQQAGRSAGTTWLHRCRRVADAVGYMLINFPPESAVG